MQKNPIVTGYNSILQTCCIYDYKPMQIYIQVHDHTQIPTFKLHWSFYMCCISVCVYVFHSWQYMCMYVHNVLGVYFCVHACMHGVLVRMFVYLCSGMIRDQ